jgi:hypothetical protein
MPDLSQTQLSDLTGKDRKTVSRRLEPLHPKDGPRGAMLYDSRKAVELIYEVRINGKTIDEAKKEDYIQRAALAKVRREELERKRIPIELVLSVHDQALQALVAQLKSAEGKVLTVDLINAMLAEFRSIPDKLKW